MIKTKSQKINLLRETCRIEGVNIFLGVRDVVDKTTSFDKDGNPIDSFYTEFKCETWDGGGGSSSIQGCIGSETCKELARFFDKIGYKLEERREKNK